MERVVFCPAHRHFPEEVLTSIADDEQMVVLDEHGEPTGHWFDGTIGLTPEQEDEAREDDSPWCREHRDEECEWRDDPAAAFPELGVGDLEHLGTFRQDSFRLDIWNTGMTDERDGKARLAYALRFGDEVIFEGTEFYPAPSLDLDSDETAGELLSFLSLRPGWDAEDEYFEKYTDRQREFALEHGEMLSLWGHELEGDLDE